MSIQLNLLTLMAAATYTCSGGSTGLTAPNDGLPMNGSPGAVTVGNIFFRSARNGSVNPAVDTVAAGTMVTWTWTNTGAEPHSVRSLGAPGFPSSATLAGSGRTYSVTFTSPGVYQYDCAVHGAQMTGTIVVQ
ncbi:MAG TPA: plastocyanin/azurin family copper-binding protein [Gemmatimonadales bacterium]|jgi:plastocyanin